MLSKNQYLFVKLLVVLSLLFFTQSAFAESSEKKISINYPLVSDKNSELNQKIGRLIYNKFKDAGYEMTAKADIELLLVTCTLNNSKEVAVNIIYMNSLPKEILDFNVKNESFYMQVKDNKKYPEEGKFVREMVTEEVLLNYRTPVNYDSVIISTDNLETEISKIFDLAVKRLESWNKKK